ncbi:hypothetical protein OKW21_006440 [Catalinimonas alkaloidigena]|uniref:hypothetical protein n=1 Tax=Catalinimonas alkaloidigena TaxID=1075417 RepID=UPI0024067169|nr:hypothetical protein [Catalinimonas alkaloidigena]MDF9801177.1 hypothetical protein [Catalinimonas alkaloidigena]
MSFRSINVIIEPRHFFPWIAQKIQVDGQATFYVKRTYRLLSATTKVKRINPRGLEIKIHKPFIHSSGFEIITAGKNYRIRKISYWQWECRCEEEVIMVNRLGGIKCVLSQEGRQLAIMSLGTNLPFVKDRNTYIRVNSDDYLHIAIASALLISGFGININPLLLNNNKMSSSMRPIEIA